MNLIDTADVYGLDWGGTGVRPGRGAARPGARRRRRRCATGWCWPPRAASGRRSPYDSSPAGAAGGVRGLAAAPAGRRHRPLPGPPARHVHPPGRRRGDAGRAPRGGQDPRGRRVQPHAGAGRRRCRPTCRSRSPATSPSTRPPTSIRCATARSTPACATGSRRWRGARWPAAVWRPARACGPSCWPRSTRSPGARASSAATWRWRSCSPIRRRRWRSSDADTRSGSSPSTTALARPPRSGRRLPHRAGQRGRPAALTSAFCVTAYSPRGRVR